MQVDRFSLSGGQYQAINKFQTNYSTPSGYGSEITIPSGSYSQYAWCGQNGDGYFAIRMRKDTYTSGTTGTASPYTSALGSGTPLDITPAYYTVHVWKRLS